MCTTCQTVNGTDTGEAFAGRMMDMMNHATLALMTSIGHRTGLFDTMAHRAASTPQQIADAAGLHERYVREWLGAMATARIVDHDADAGTYWLPEAHAAFLTRDASPDNIALAMQWIAVLASVEDKLVDVFRSGGGVPYEAFNRFNEVMAEESNQSVVSGLIDHVLPLAPGITAKIEAGIDVLDCGCGSGRAIIELATHFPHSHFTGYDLLPDAIDAAKIEAARRGVSNVHFVPRDVSKPFGERRFDLITTFDAVHDQADPDALLANIHAALKDDGVYIMQDIKMRSAHADNMDNPLAPFIYSISTMHCMTVSLAQGGKGLGAAWGRELALQMLGEAGFGNVRVEELAHDIMNYWYIVQKAPRPQTQAA